MALSHIAVMPLLQSLCSIKNNAWWLSVILSPRHNKQEALASWSDGIRPLQENTALLDHILVGLRTILPHDILRCHISNALNLWLCCQDAWGRFWWLVDLTVFYFNRSRGTSWRLCCYWPGPVCHKISRISTQSEKLVLPTAFIVGYCWYPLLCSRNCPECC